MLYLNMEFPKALHLDQSFSLFILIHAIKVYSKNLVDELVNFDMKDLSVWLNAYKISLNVQKTELLIFK